ncbi:C40 family peptidase [uncultured Polaribacter sp.]|uniref:C40 family peptidase n=1 Tax=uncultured Polaribacter sp. TaxID=174711 RepID=UPI0026041523|nr:C40 family peptidase [uncultured Polaribacter sp.]
MKITKIFSLLIVILLFSCSNNTKLISGLKSVSRSIQEQYAPDKRVAIFNINFGYSDGKIIVTGTTDTKEAYLKLLDTLKSLEIKFVNKIRVLPDTTLGNKKYAVARNSVINIRSAPKHSAELGTQGLLGMSLKVLDNEGDFYRIQTPDKYISWVDKGGITLMNKEELDQWDNNKKIIYTKNFGYVYADKSTNASIVSDISLGGILKLVSLHPNYVKVAYPDNRVGFIKRDEALMYDAWLDNLNPTESNVEKIAKTMEGFPYLWGGTSAKGMDCSGFTKMVYLMNGFIIPRDASQQIHAGKKVDVNLNFSDLQKGDLLFFGKKATLNKQQRVTHVGIWLGNNKQEFIHASGNVHISSMDANHPLYDEYNKNRYIGSRRYLGIKDKNIIDLRDKLKL